MLVGGGSFAVMQFLTANYIGPELPDITSAIVSLVVLTLFVINRLLRMPLGRAWEALREDEIACRSLGLSPTRIKLTAFTISAAFAGFAGTLFAARQGFVSPESFTFQESALATASDSLAFSTSRSASRVAILARACSKASRAVSSL